MREILTKTGDFVNRRQRDVLLAMTMGLIAWSFYSIGRLTAGQAGTFSIRTEQTDHPVSRDETAAFRDSRVVVSKSSSSKKYHHTWCSGAQRIKPENQVWFETAAAAETAGYTLAGNCN